MNLFYKQRKNIHTKHMMRYLKYVFNDHFLLVMLIAMGGFGLYYSEFVKSLTPEFFLGRPFVIIIWSMSLLIGKIATLLKEPDMIFLLPKERQMTTYLKESFKGSIILPFGMILLISGITMPLLVATSNIEFSDFYMLVINLWLLKLAHLLIQIQGLYLNTKKITRIEESILLLLTIVSLIVNLYVVPWAGAICSFLFVIVCYQQTKKSLNENPLDWEKSIRLERKRLKKIYSFINLFTDVPGLQADIKRRAYLDVFLNKIKKEQRQTYTYLYARVFLRGTEYSGLVIRLTVIGGLILFFSDQLILNAIISVLFVYLIGFQLLPIYNEFDYMLMTQLYPIKKEQKLNAVENLIRKILMGVITIFSVVILIKLQDKVGGLLIIGLMIIEGIVFTKLYAPRRLKKLDKSLI
ncbi:MULTISPECIES: ABC transporter permease [Vagococcus]|uniref:ABC transporter, permease protein EscB n=1 Tax=Vagococcus fluvialis bH819 TaxID=1255619 RepID=A0A1X6WLN9_9ENTE|nr:MULTISPECIES: ABC transporter permease [Vagococcus]SLM85187.1 ABC transporter, permease protein EscB [Vagococcus fluvialis bH819]HCM88400.1 multidrug ABC transporter permease [Vagococcus sp.]